jgi:drug/metabolite transporter (DMT)-like permease
MLAGLGFGALLICLSLAPESSGVWALVPARAAGGIALVVVALGLRRGFLPTRRSLVPGIGAGALTVFGNAAFIIATTKGSLAVVSVLAAMFPAATVILARIVLGERIPRRRRVGLALALVAVGLVAGG